MGLSDSSISSLLNSLGSGNNSSGSFDFANYAAIKNGSYGKLVKSYYAEQNKTSDTKTASSNAKSKTSTKTDSNKNTDTTGLTQMKKDADKLRASAEALDNDDLWKKTDGKVDMTKVASAIKDFAKDYNAVIDQSAKVNSKEIGQDMKFMTGMTDTFNKILSKIGITVGDNGKMSVDEEALKKADVATVKTLFDGHGTYGSQIAEKASSISKDTEMSTSIYGSNATASSALSSLYNQFV